VFNSGETPNIRTPDDIIENADVYLVGGTADTMHKRSLWTALPHTNVN